MTTEELIQKSKVQVDIRNPVIAPELEVLKITENRHSGIPLIRRTMQEYGLPISEFMDERGSFIVKFFKYGDVTTSASRELKHNIN